MSHTFNLTAVPCNGKNKVQTDDPIHASSAVPQLLTNLFSGVNMKRSFLVRAMCAAFGAAAFMPLAMAQPSPQTIEKGFFTVAFTGDMPGTGY